MKRIFILILMIVGMVLLSAQQKPEFESHSSKDQFPEETWKKNDTRSQTPDSPGSGDEVAALRNLVDKQQAAIETLQAENRKLSERIEALEEENKLLKEKQKEKK